MPCGSSLAFHAGLHVLRGRVELLAFGDRGSALVIGHQRLHIRRRGHRQRAPALSVGMNSPTVRLLRTRYFAATAFTASGVTFSIRSRIQKIEPPVALDRPFAQRDAHLGGVGGRPLAGLENLLLGAVDLFSCDALRRRSPRRVEIRISRTSSRRTVARHLGIQP